MKTIPLTQGLVAMVDDEDFAELSKHRWYAHQHYKVYYARRCLPRVNGEAKRGEMHQVIMGRKGIDHKDGDGLNNQKSNLRIATTSQNQANRTRQATNSSGRRGVTWHRVRGRWQASICKDDKRIYLGLFNDLDDAARAYDAAARSLFGEFARPNFEAVS